MEKPIRRARKGLLALMVALAAGACGHRGAPLGEPVGSAETAAAQAAGPGPTSTNAAPNAAHAAIAAFAARLAADVAQDSVGALAAAVVLGDSVAWAGAFGERDRGTGEPATVATLFRAGSITKVVTAAAMMRLAGRGVLTLDQPVALRVPEVVGLAGFRAGDRPITYRDLASHTAGLEREPASSLADRGRPEHWSQKVASAIPLTDALWSPGERYHYSNVGYGILGLALERAAGSPYDEVIAAEVLTPLGMRSTSLQVPRRSMERLAAGYVNLPDGTVDPRVPRGEHRGRGYKVPSEGLYTTVGDLALLVMALSGAAGDTLLDAGARAAMLADHDPDSDDRTGYGLGLQLTRVGDTVLAGHSGRAAGYASYMVFDPVSRAGVVLLRSYNRGETNLAAVAQGLVLDLAGGG